MLESLVFSIVKIEGLGDLGKSDCFFVDGSQETFRSPLKNLPVSFNIQSPGNLTLCIRDCESGTIIASVSFDAGILPCEWFYWLPLFLSAENLITELPMKISLPRILVGVNKEILVPSVNEISENSDANEEDPGKIETIFAQNVDPELHDFKLNLIQDTQSSDSCSKEENQILIKHYRKIIKNMTKEIAREKDLAAQKFRELQGQLERSREETELERKYRIDMQEKFEHCTVLYENMRKREEGLMKIIVKKCRAFQFVIESQESISVLPSRLPLEERTPKLYLNDTVTIPSSIEKKVSDLLSRLKLIGLMRKSRDVNYQIGAKTVTLCLKQGEVFCKSGQSLDSYIFKNCKSEIEQLLRNRASPIKKQGSPSRSPLNTCRTPGLYTQRIVKF